MSSNELPIAGKPADVYATLETAHAAIAASTDPKLLFAADPGALVSPALAEGLARELNDCRLVRLGSGVHLLQEDHPETIGRSVAAFIGEVEGGRSAKTAA
jgi:haloalkane dehalogenase